MELDLDKLSALRVLGSGAMGTVFLVIDRSGHPSRAPVFALKVVEKHSPTAKPDADRRARWELSVLSRLAPHPFLMGPSSQILFSSLHNARHPLRARDSTMDISN